MPFHGHLPETVPCYGRRFHVYLPFDGKREMASVARLIAIYFRSPRIRTPDPTIKTTSAANTATFTTASTMLLLPKRFAVFLLIRRRPEIFPATKDDGTFGRPRTYS
jgi:hypothetical protein